MKQVNFSWKERQDHLVQSEILKGGNIIRLRSYFPAYFHLFSGASFLRNIHKIFAKSCTGDKFVHILLAQSTELWKFEQKVRKTIIKIHLKIKGEQKLSGPQSPSREGFGFRYTMISLLSYIFRKSVLKSVICLIMIG